MSQNTFLSTSFLIRDIEGEYRQANAQEIVQEARRLLSSKVRRGTCLSSPALVRDFLSLRMAELGHEVFSVLFLDAQHRLIEYQTMFRGTLTQTSVYPREVIKVALAHNAAAVILAHNHPSGHGEPSKADELLTQTLQSALTLVDVKVLDHMIVAGGEVTSFAERGLL